MSAGPTDFPDLNRVLADLAGRAAACLAGEFVGAYLQGSFALGAGDRNSDADFIVVTRGDIFPGVVPALDAMHGALHDRPEEWAQHLEGSYVPAAVLRTAAGAPRPLLFLNNGDRTLSRSGHDDTNVVRWVLRERGIVLAGPDPRGLVAPVPADALCGEMRETMRTFGDEVLGGACPVDVLWRQGFTVLFCCRALAGIAAAAVVSKPAAVRWAEANLDPRWRPLIARAFAQRDRYPRGRGAPEAHAALGPEAGDAALTREFVRYALSLASGKARAATAAPRQRPAATSEG